MLGDFFTNVNNIENDLLEYLSSKDSFKCTHIKKINSSHILPNYWINNASNLEGNKICTYGSMLDSQGNCGNCIFLIPDTHGDVDSISDNDIYICCTYLG